MQGYSGEKTDLRYFPTSPTLGLASGSRWWREWDQRVRAVRRRSHGWWRSESRPVAPVPMNGSRTVLGIIAAGRSRRTVAHWRDASRHACDTSAFWPRLPAHFALPAESRIGTRL